MYTIGNKIFKTKKECYSYTKNIINSLGSCEINKDHNYFIFFCDLLKNHTEYDEKVGCGIDRFCIIKNKLNPNFYGMELHRLDNTKINFSWVHCCEFKKRSYDWHLSSAMRSSIMKTIINFKTKNKLECSMCKISDHDTIYHVDHIIPFINLKNDFLKTTKLTLPEARRSLATVSTPEGIEPISFSTCSNTGLCVFGDDDSGFKNDWISYHDENCKLQILCRSCNILKGKKCE